MLRDKWDFEYTGAQLCEAAAKRIAFHEERLKWWKDKRQVVMGQIRSEGLEINESLAMAYQSPKSRDWAEGTQVTIRNDLKQALNECQKKLSYHTERLSDFLGWFKMLKANPDARKPLDLNDWLFFFTEGGPDSESDIDKLLGNLSWD